LPAHIKLAYLPGAGMVKLRLTGRGADKESLEKELEKRQTEIAQRLEKNVIALEDLTLEQILGKWFTDNHKTLGLAESCTGGNIGHHITQVMGATNYFKGSLVCYQNEIKEKLLGVKHETLGEFGAISEQVAVEMVKGTLEALDPDVAFAITGLLSPLENSRVPVGTVWMAVTDKNRIKTKEFHFPYDRERNKEMATSMAMLMIWKFTHPIAGDELK
jgi:nicotinamide-nucleotide amidase